MDTSFWTLPLFLWLDSTVCILLRFNWVTSMQYLDLLKGEGDGDHQASDKTGIKV